MAFTTVTAATTREKLMMQIMERKRRAIDAVKQQVEEFDHYLSSLCILRGLPPPSLSSSQLNKEELISEVLLPRQHTNCYTGGQNSFHQMIVPDVQIRKWEEASSRDVSALNRGVTASDRLSVSPLLPTADAECALDEFAGAGGATASPQECRDVLVSDSHAKPLARIERSKSRQKALKLRNSAKADKTCSRDLQDVCGSSGQILEARTESLQHDHSSDLRLVESVSTNDRICTENDEKIGGGTLGEEQFGDERSARSLSSDKMNDSQDAAGNLSDLPNISKEDGDREEIHRLKDQSGCGEALCETVNHSSVAVGASCAAEDISGGECNKKFSNVYSGLPMRSFGIASGGEKVNLDTEYACSGDKDLMRPRFSSHESTQQPDNVNQLGKQAKTSYVVPSGSNGAKIMTGYISMDDEGDVFPEIVIRSRSSVQQSDIAREHLKLDPSCSYGKGECIDNVKQLYHHGDDSRYKSSSCDFNRNCRLEVQTSVLQGSKGKNNFYKDGIERPNSCHQQHSEAGASLMENGSCSVSLEANAGELWQAPSQSLIGGSDGHQESFVSDTKLSLQFESRNVVERESCDAIPALSGRDSERLVQNEVTSFTYVTGPCLGIEMVDTKSPTNSAVLVQPQQLNFDEEEDLTSMEMGDSIVNNCQHKPDSWIEDAMSEEKQLSREIHKPAQESSEKEVRNHAISLEPDMSEADQLDNISGISEYQNAGNHSLDSLPLRNQIKTINSNELQSASPILKTNQCQLICSDSVVDAKKLDSGKRLTKCEDQNGEQPSLEPEVLSPEEQHEQVGPNQEIMEQNACNASILIHDQVAECSSLGPVLPTSEVSQVWLGNSEMADSSGSILSDRGLPIEKRSPELHQYADRLSLPTMELLTFVDESVHEWKSDLLWNKNMSCGSCSSPLCEPIKGISPDQNMPEFEGFVLESNAGQERITVNGVDFNKLDLPSNVLERASVLERLCKSACMNTPISNFSSTYKFHHGQELYRSIPNNVLEVMQLRNTLGMCVPGKEIDADNSSLVKESNCSSQSAKETVKPYMSPVRKLWDGIIKSGSSEKRASSATDLPCISEENELDEAADTFEEGHALEMADVLVKRDPLADITGNSNLPTSVCENEVPYDRCSVASTNMDPMSCSKANSRPQNYSNNGGRRQTEKEKQSASMGLSGIKRANNSLQQRVTRAKLSEKTGLRKVAQSTSEESKPSNIVSNVTSFIPLVQRKQAQPVAAGKREVKVKALEAAEAAKRLAEKKENERRMKQEALKLDREKKGEERRKNEADMAAKKQREEEERRKHEADMATRKRQKEEDERKEKERKRQREENERKDKERKRQREEDERKEKERKRKRVEKPKKQDARISEQRRPQEEPRQWEKMGNAKGDKSLDKVPEYQYATPSTFADDTSKASIVVTEEEHLNGCGDNQKVSNDHYEAEEPSYEISPYKCSDDEAEEDDYEDENPNYKFVPDWASRSAVARILSSQKRIDPKSVFPPGSFCYVDEVLMPRRLQNNTRLSQQNNAVPR